MMPITKVEGGLKIRNNRSRFREIEFEIYEKWQKLCQKHETPCTKRGCVLSSEDFKMFIKRSSQDRRLRESADTTYS